MEICSLFAPHFAPHSLDIIDSIGKFVIIDTIDTVAIMTVVISISKILTIDEEQIR